MADADHASALDDIFSLDAAGEPPAALPAAPAVRLPQLDLMQGDEASAFAVGGDDDADPILAGVFDAFGSPAPVRSRSPPTAAGGGGRAAAAAGGGADDDMDDLLSSMEALLGPSSPAGAGNEASRKGSLTIGSPDSPTPPAGSLERGGVAAVAVDVTHAPASPPPLPAAASEAVQPTATEAAHASPVAEAAPAVAASELAPAPAPVPAPSAASAETTTAAVSAPEPAPADLPNVEAELAAEAGDVEEGVEAGAADGDAQDASGDAPQTPATPVATMPLVAPIIRYVAPSEALPSSVASEAFWEGQLAAAAAKAGHLLGADDELLAFCVAAAHVHPRLRARAWVAACNRAVCLYELERPEAALFHPETGAALALLPAVEAALAAMESDDEADVWSELWCDANAVDAATPSLSKAAAVRVLAAFCGRRGFTPASPPSLTYLSHLARVASPVLFVELPQAVRKEAAASTTLASELLALQLLEGVAATLFPTLLMHPDAWAANSTSGDATPAAPVDTPPLSHSSWRRLSECTRLLVQYHEPALAVALNDACPGWHKLVAPTSLKPAVVAAAPRKVPEAEAAAEGTATAAAADTAAAAPATTAAPAGEVEEANPGCLPLSWFAHGFVAPGASPALVLPLWDRLLLAAFTLHDRDAKRAADAPDSEVGGDLMSWPKGGGGGLAFGIAALVVALLKAEAPRLLMLCPTAGADGAEEGRPRRQRGGAGAAAASASASYLVRLTLQGAVKRLLSPAAAGAPTLEATAAWVADATTLARNVPTLFAASVAAAIPTTRAAALRVPSAETAAQLVFGWARVSGAYVTAAGAKASGPSRGAPVLWPGLGTDAEGAAAATGLAVGDGSVVPPPVTGPPVRYLLVDVRPVLHRRAGRIAIAFHVDPASCAVGGEEDEEEAAVAGAPSEEKDAAPAPAEGSSNAAPGEETAAAAAPSAAAVLFSPGTIEAAGTGTASRTRRASTAGQAAVAAFEAGVDDAVKAAPFSPGSPTQAPLPTPPAEAAEEAAPAAASVSSSSSGVSEGEAVAAAEAGAAAGLSEAPASLETSVEPPATPTKVSAASANSSSVHTRAEPVVASPASAQGVPLAAAVEQLREIVAQADDVHVLVVGVGVRLIASAYEPQLLDACAKQDEERVKAVVTALVRAGVPRVSIAQGGYAELHRLVRTRSVPPPLGLASLFPSLACPRPDATAPSPSSALSMLYRVVLVEHVPRGCPCCRHMAVVRMAARAAAAAEAAAGKDGAGKADKAAAAAAKISELAASAKSTVTTLYQGWKTKRAEKAAAEKAEKERAEKEKAEKAGAEGGVDSGSVGAAAAVAATEGTPAVAATPAPSEPTLGDRAAKAKAAAARLFRSALAPPPAPAPGTSGGSVGEVPLATMSAFLGGAEGGGSSGGGADGTVAAAAGGEAHAEAGAAAGRERASSSASAAPVSSEAPAPAPAPAAASSSLGWGALAKRKLAAALAPPPEEAAAPAPAPAPAPAAATSAASTPAPAPAPAPAGKSLSSMFGGFKSKVAAFAAINNSSSSAPAAAAPASAAPAPAPASPWAPPSGGFTVGAALSAVAARDRTRSGSGAFASLFSSSSAAPAPAAAPTSNPPSAPSSRPTSVALSGRPSSTSLALSDGPRDPAEAVRALALAGLGKGSTLVLDDWAGAARVFAARKEKEVSVVTAAAAPVVSAAGGGKEEGGEAAASAPGATPAKAPSSAEPLPFQSPPPSAFSVGGDEEDEETVDDGNGSSKAATAAAPAPAASKEAAAPASSSTEEEEEVEAASHTPAGAAAAAAAAATTTVQLVPRLLCLVRDRLLVLEASEGADTSSGRATVKSNHHLTELGKLTFTKKAPQRLVLWYRRGPAPDAATAAAAGEERLVPRAYHVERAAELREALQAAVAAFKE